MKILAYRFLNCRFLHAGFYCNNNNNNTIIIVIIMIITVM